MVGLLQRMYGGWDSHLNLLVNYALTMRILAIFAKPL